MQPKFDGPVINGELNEWITENWKTVRCAAGAAPALALTAYKAAMTFKGKPQNLYEAINNGIMLGTYLSDCFIEEPNVEQFFPESEEECQCATAGGQLWASVTVDGNVEKQAIGSSLEAKEIIETEIDKDGDSLCQYATTSGSWTFAEIQRPEDAEQFSVYWYISPAPGSVCCGEFPKPLEEPETPPPFEIPLIRYPGDEQTCNAEVVLIDSEIDAQGILWNKYHVSAPDCPGWLTPRCYWESRIGVYFPNECGSPPPFALYEDPTLNLPGLNPVSYRLHVPCSWDKDQGGFTEWIDYDIEGTDNGILGLARRIDALAYLLDRATQFPYRECANVKPTLEGDWVTIAWISDESSSDSPLRLRKRTRYRSKSDRDSKQLQSYFATFKWDAGPVCVIHADAWWGTPQVWASTEAEGKRVLRHIAGEAGIDPDQVGRWITRGSNNPRIGMAGRMGVRRIDGIPWVSRRDGSNMLPM